MPDKFAEYKNTGLINTLRSRQLFTGLPLADLEKIAAGPASSAPASLRPNSGPNVTPFYESQ